MSSGQQPERRTVFGAHFLFRTLLYLVESRENLIPAVHKERFLLILHHPLQSCVH
jgi:hypothetical protein